jgi:NADPH-dependent curcumin reductase
MTLPATYHAWIIDHYAKDGLDGGELRWEERPLAPLEPGQVLIQTRLLSLDASNLLWMSEKKDYLDQLQIGDVMRGNIIGRIAASEHPAFAVGEHVMALQGWADYAVVDGEALLNDKVTMKIVPHPEVPLDAYIGTLGITGWSAYIGMMEVGRLQAGERVLVSGAAGATGIMAAQIAKAAGAHVYGLAGGAEKCQFLKEALQLDGVIDYKAAGNLEAAIREAIPEGVEVFFDNVGGETLEAALANMCIKGRIVASGSVSQYGRAEQYGIKNLPLITTRRLRMEGFLILDYLDQVPELLKTMEQWLLAGKLINKNHLVHGLENAQAALPKLLTGGNTGKLAIYVAD